MKKVDLLIIGAGPASLTASIYASRYKINHLIIGSEIGGYMNETPDIENYPGFPSISGFELGQKFSDHAKKLGGEIIQSKIEKIEKNKGLFEVKTANEDFSAKKIIYGIGTKIRHLEIPGEKEFVGRGVSYCATCDGPFFKEKDVTVVGGGNSAAIAAMMLSKYAKNVTLFYRGEKLSAMPVYLDQMEKIKNLEIACCTNLTEIKGDNTIKSVILDQPHNGKKEFKTNGIFIEIGSQPDTMLLEKLNIETDKLGYIKTNPDQSTSIENFFAIGDISTNSNGFRQIITACSEGAIAAQSVFECLK